MREIFDEIINTIENDDIREFAKKCVEAAPEYFFLVPASSTRKYHPAYACTTPLGLAKHTLALVKFLNFMFEVESVSNQFTSRERDLLRVAGIAHDMLKSGTQSEYEKNHYTKFDHPLLAARMLQNIDGLSREEKIFIGKAISSHMGAWNTDKRYPNVVLPKPESKYQIILHLADYLASRKDIEFKFDKQGTEQQQEPLPDINKWKFTFGKHSGKTIPEVAATDPGYIKWARNNMEKEPARSLLKNYATKG